MSKKKSVSTVKAQTDLSNKSVKTGNDKHSSSFLNRFGRLITLLIIAIAVAVVSILNTSETKKVSCTTPSCFSPVFKTCSPAVFNYTIRSLGIIRYEILNSNVNGLGCDIKLAYIKNPNKAWENKPMTCTFDNRKTFDQALSDVFRDLLSGTNRHNCSGPLVAIIQRAAGH